MKHDPNTVLVLEVQRRLQSASRAEALTVASMALQVAHLKTPNSKSQSLSDALGIVLREQQLEDDQ